jgi:hypothetical protein
MINFIKDHILLVLIIITIIIYFNLQYNNDINILNNKKPERFIGKYISSYIYNEDDTIKRSIVKHNCSVRLDLLNKLNQSGLISNYNMKKFINENYRYCNNL